MSSIQSKLAGMQKKTGKHNPQWEKKNSSGINAALTISKLKTLKDNHIPHIQKDKSESENTV